MGGCDEKYLLEGAAESRRRASRARASRQNSRPAPTSRVALVRVLPVVHRSGRVLARRRHRAAPGENVPTLRGGEADGGGRSRGRRGGDRGAARRERPVAHAAARPRLPSRAGPRGGAVMKEPVLVSPALTGQNGDHVATLDGIAATLGTPGGARELQARLDQSGRGDPEMQSEQAQVKLLLEEAAATVDPWALLDQIEKGVPLKEGEQLPRARLGLYDQAMAAITNERHAATREMLCKRASQVFEGVPLARIRADVQRLLPASANDKKVVVTDPEPWPDPIENGAMLLD